MNFFKLGEGEDMELKKDNKKNIKNKRELLFFLFLKIIEKKKWWLLPLFLLLLIASLFINVFSSGRILPVIYTFF